MQDVGVPLIGVLRQPEVGLLTILEQLRYVLIDDVCLCSPVCLCSCVCVCVCVCVCLFE